MERLGNRLAELLVDLASDLDYATGRRRYPRTVTADDAADLVEAFHEQVDRGVEMRAEVGRRRLMVIACARGCNTCCNEPIMVTLPEAIAVARWLSRPENEAARAGFLARYPAWEEKVGAKLESLAQASASKNEEEALALHTATRAMCPMNEEGACTVYPIRPVLCREAHALETSANCDVDGPGDVKVIPSPALDDFILKVKALFWAIHHALPGTGRRLLVPLPAAVHRLLTARL